MKKTGLLALCALFSYALAAQTSGQVAQYSSNVGNTDGLYNHAMGAIGDKLEKLDYSIESIEGSPYMDNTFSKGQLYYGDEQVGNIYFRYNAYNEEIEIKQQNLEGEPIRGLGKDKKIRLVANGESMSFKTFVDSQGNTQNGYLTLLSDGDYKLYKHIDVVFKEAKKAENSFVKGKPAKFIQFVEYYLEGPDGKRIDQVELNNKKVLNVISEDKKASLSSFLKENKLKIKGEQDLMKVLSFLNS